MHAYAVSPDFRRHAQPFAIGLGLATAYLAVWGIRTVDIIVPWWIDIPSAIGFYAVWWSLYDRFLWHTRLSCTLGLASVDLRGEWHGTLTSSYDEHRFKTEVHVEIAQTGTRILMRLTTPTSTSTTIGAMLESEEGCVSLGYLFESRPRSGTPGMHTHLGAGLLDFADETLDGEFFTGRDRETYGHLTLHRTPGSQSH